MMLASIALFLGFLVALPTTHSFFAPVRSPRVLVVTTSSLLRRFAVAGSGGRADGVPEMNYRSTHRPYSAEWAAERGMEPGFGGVWPGNPEAEKFKVTVKSRKTGETFLTEVAKDRYIYYAFEEDRTSLPIENSHKMCRQGCCTICAARIIEGKVKMDAPLGLLKELRGQNYGLLCCAMPRSDVVVELQDEDEMYKRQWSEGFEGGGVEWGGVFMDED